MNLKMLRRFIRHERGMETSEYAIMLVLIVVALITAVLFLVNQIEAMYNSTSNTFNDPP